MLVVFRSGCVVQRRTVIGSRAGVDNVTRTAAACVTRDSSGHKTCSRYERFIAVDSVEERRLCSCAACCFVAFWDVVPCCTTDVTGERGGQCGATVFLRRAILAFRAGDATRSMPLSALKRALTLA